MRSNPERVAWTILGLAFATFCILVTGLPLGIRSFLLNAADQQATRMQVIDGTVLVQKAGGGDPIGVVASNGAVALAQGDEIITDATSWATLDLFDRSQVIVYSDTKLRLSRTQAPRFSVSRHPNQVTLNLTGGFIRVGVAMPGEQPTRFRVITPHTTISVEEGSYRIAVANDVSQVTVVQGQAALGREGAEVVIPQGTRTSVDLSGVPASAQPAAQNLIANGDMVEPLASAWVTSTLVLDPSIKPPTVQVVENGGRSVVRFLRREEDNGNHSEASIQQRLNQGVRDFTRLEIALDVFLEFQSLSGGGQLSSEFPVIVRLDFKDRWGNDKFWTHGFYYQNRDGYTIALDPWGQPRGEQVPRGVWYPYESGNLLELLGDNQPVQITSLTVYASGWNYDSMVTAIRLVVE